MALHPVTSRLPVAAALVLALVAGTIYALTPSPLYDDAILRSEFYKPLTLYIDGLVRYEYPGDDPLFRIVDSNGLFSHSCLQFQEETFRTQVRKYHLADYAEDAELENFIYDCSFQKEVALQMFLHDPYAWQHWRTSVGRGLGLPPRLELAKA